MRRLGSNSPLRTELTATDAEARAIIIRSLAGLSRYVYEMAAGVSVVDGEPPCVPLNPQGLIGVDLSGPPFGPALLHVMGGRGGMKPTTDVAGEKTLGSCTNTVSLEERIGVISKPFSPSYGAPYSRRYVYFRAWCASGGPIDVTVSILDPDGVAISGRSASISITNTTEATYSDSDLWVDPDGGFVRFVGSSATAVHVGAVTLNNIAKLSHV